MRRCHGLLLSALPASVKQLWRAAWVVSGTWVLLALPAQAGSPLSVRVAVTGAPGEARCPGQGELLSALRQALPISDALIPGTDPHSEVVLRDLGAEFVIYVLDQRRRFTNPLRTCSERARIAAVFASLALHPPELDGAPAAVAAPPSHRGPTAILEAVGMLGVAAGSADPILTGGGALRLYLGTSRLGGSLGLHGLAGQSQRFSAGVAQVLLFPIDLTVRVRWRGSRVQLAGEAGVLGSLLRIDASGSTAPGSKTPFAPAEPVLRLDAGVRLAIDVRSQVSARVAPLLGIDVWLWPRPYQLVLEPQGVVAELPWLTVMGRVGLALQVR